MSGSAEEVDRLSFAPPPANDFADFISEVWTRCRHHAPEIEAIAGKWAFEDLVPGLSDFDTRFLCADSMTGEAWCRLSAAIGEAHLELCREHPKWARNLEHLPGTSFTWCEAGDEVLYCPELQQWTFYDTVNPGALESLRQHLASRPWDAKDERYELNRFLEYFVPYDERLDPPINLGEQTLKHFLHSRLMHWFNPPVKAAMSLLLKRNVVGKLESFRLADEWFPSQLIYREALELIERHYADPHLYEPAALRDLEMRSFQALQELAQAIAPELTLIPAELRNHPERWKETMAGLPVSPALRIFDLTKFARFTKGRLQYYLSAPEHFDVEDLLRVELRRIGEWFFTRTIRIYWETVYGPAEETSDVLLRKLPPGLLDEEEVICALRFNELANGPWQGREREVVAGIVEIFDPFYTAIHKLTCDLRAREG